MEQDSNPPVKRNTFLKRLRNVAAIIFVLASGTCIYLYFNFNSLLSEALLKNFNSSINSDVYELSFEKLRVNFISGDISVIDVHIKPREKPLNDYPYINSTFRLYTHRLRLVNIEIMALLKENIFRLDKIEIDKPEIQLRLTGKYPIFFPIQDTVTVQKNKSGKRFVENFRLIEFRLNKASIHVFNAFKEREFRINDFNISLDRLELSQLISSNFFTVDQLKINIGKFGGRMMKGPARLISVNDYRLQVDSFRIEKTVDTLVYTFKDYSLAFDSLHLVTQDSIFDVSLGSFNLSYRQKLIELKQLSFLPNVKREEFQKKFKYQNTQFEGSIGELKFVNVNFDSLIYHKKIFIDDVSLDSVTATIFKNNSKLLDTSKFPKYLGEMVKSVPLPLKIDSLHAMRVNLVYLELKPDNSMAKVNINRMTATAGNITNLPQKLPLDASAICFIENKVNAYANLKFSYEKPQFDLSVKMKTFNMVDLNPVFAAFTPAKVNSGIVDEITLSGTVFDSYATGTMKFLYHDLNVDLNLKNSAKWKSTLGALAANAYLPASNPSSPDVPARIVKYRAERIMNKGFINIIVKSALAGLKESVMMSKENRKAYKKEKKKMKEKNKK